MWSVCLSFITLTGEGITYESLWRSNKYTTRFQMIPSAQMFHISQQNLSTQGEKTLRTDSKETNGSAWSYADPSTKQMFKGVWAFFLYSVRRCPKRNSNTGSDIKRVLLEDQSPRNPLKMETRSSVLSKNWFLDLSDVGNSDYLQGSYKAIKVFYVL